MKIAKIEDDRVLSAFILERDFEGITFNPEEKKMGIKGSSTCVINFDNSQGFLIGPEHRGLACMFTMMNAERLAIGIQGLFAFEFLTGDGCDAPPLDADIADRVQSGFGVDALSSDDDEIIRAGLIARELDLGFRSGRGGHGREGGGRDTTGGGKLDEVAAGIGV